MNAQDREVIGRIATALERIASALEEKAPTYVLNSLMGPVHLPRPVTDARAKTARTHDV